MSRNWTPREMYFVDLEATKQGRPLRGTLNTLVFVDPKGNQIPFINEDEKKVLSMFKELGFLFSDNLYHLWVSTNEHPRIRKKVLMEMEQELENIIDNDKNGKSFTMYDDILVRWYMGELDPNFYYSEYNNELLEQYLYEKIMKK